MKLTVTSFFCLVALTYSARAQDIPEPVLNHVAFSVTDLQKSTAFYRDLLHLPLMDEPFKDGKHTWFKLGQNGQLHLIEGLKKKEVRERNTHLCFSVRSVKNMMAVLDKQGIDYTNVKGDGKVPIPRPDGVLQIYLQDPDGYWIEVNDDKAR